jgi:hypothetical protein
MSPVRSTSTNPGRLQSVLVWWLAGMVFALGLLSVSPAAHAHLHAHAHDGDHASHSHADHAHEHPAPAVSHDDSGCAVTLFQQGVTTPLDLPRLESPRTALIATLASTPADSPLPAPHHRLQPARGPPCIG